MSAAEASNAEAKTLMAEAVVLEVEELEQLKQLQLFEEAHGKAESTLAETRCHLLQVCFCSAYMASLIQSALQSAVSPTSCAS